MSVPVGAIILALLSGSFVQAFAQGAPVSGTYRDDSGFEISFPEGWQGELLRAGPVVAPPAEAGVLLGVVAVHRTETRELILSEILLGQPSNSTACPAVVNELVHLNGTKVFHAVHECSDPYRKTESYVFFTLTESFAISYSAQSAEQFERYAPDFQRSLNTIKVDEPLNFRTGLEIILGTTSFFATGIETQPGNSTNLVVGTTSVLTGVEYDDGDIIVTVDEQRRSEGRLLMPVDTIENDTYAVEVDGEAAPSHLINDVEEDEQLVLVQYDKGEHEIRISGVEVIPEFPLHVMGVLAAVLAGAALYQRSRQKNAKL